MGHLEDFAEWKRKKAEADEEEKKKLEAQQAALNRQSKAREGLSPYEQFKYDKILKERGEEPVYSFDLPKAEETKPLEERLAARGVTIEWPEQKQKTAAPAAETFPSREEQGTHFDIGVRNIVREREEERKSQEAAAAEAYRDATVRNKDWMSSLRSADEIEAELEAARKETGSAKALDFLEGLAGDFRGLVDSEYRNGEHEYDTRQKENSEKISALEDELATRKWADYEKLRENEDFREKSQYQKGWADWHNYDRLRAAMDPEYAAKYFSDPVYDYINGSEEAGEVLKARMDKEARTLGFFGSENAGDEVQYTQLRYLTADERQMYNYLHATDGKAAADGYLEYLRSDLYRRQAEKEKKEVEEFAGKNPLNAVLASAGTLAASPFKGMAYGRQLADLLEDGVIDENAPYNRISYLSSAARDRVTNDITEKWGKWGAFAYGTGMSMLEFLLNNAVTGGAEAASLAVMGTGAAVDATLGAKARGLGDTDAFVLGTIAGAAEIVSEKVSIEALFKDTDWRVQPLRYVLKNIFFEGAEEVESDVINWMADALVARDKSEWMDDIRAYQKDHPGASEGKAFEAAVLKRIEEGGMDFLGGAISGGIMAGGRVGIDQTVRRAQMRADVSSDIEAARAAMNAKKRAEISSDIEAARSDVIADVSADLEAEMEAQEDAAITLPTAEEAETVAGVLKTAEEIEAERAGAPEEAAPEGIEEPAAEETGEAEPDDWAVDASEPAADSTYSPRESGRFDVRERSAAEESGVKFADLDSSTLRFGSEAAPEDSMRLKTAAETEREAEIRKAEESGNVTRATGLRFGIDEKTIRKAERYSEMTGHRLQFYSGQARNGAVENGFTNTKTGDIFMNKNTKKAFEFVFGHELTHNLEGTDEYRAMMDHIKSRAAEQGMDWLRRRADMRALYERGTGETLTDEQIDEEIAADWIGDNLSDERTIREICREDPSVGKRIRDALDGFLVRAGNIGGVVTGYEQKKYRNIIGMMDRYIGEANRNLERQVEAAAAEAPEESEAVADTAEEETAEESAGGAETRESAGTGEKSTAGRNVRTAASGAVTRTSEADRGTAADRAEQLRARIEERYDAGEITDEEYDEAMALADEMESTGLGYETGAVEDEGPRWKIGEIVDRILKRRSLSEVTAEEDEAYLAAVRDGDMESAQQMVDAAARKAGYPKKVYHGGADVTVFDTERGKGGTTQFGPGTYVFDLKEYASEWALAQNGKVTNLYLKDGAYLEGDGRIQDEGEEWENLKAILRNRYGLKDRDIRFVQQWGMGALKRITNEGQDVPNGDFTYADTANRIVREAGYLGIHGSLFEAKQWCVFNPQDLKSADPVTYDDNGEPIKLSKRFDDRKPDIRWSMSESEEAQGPWRNAVRALSERWEGITGSEFRTALEDVYEALERSTPRNADGTYDFAHIDSAAMSAAMQKEARRLVNNAAVKEANPEYNRLMDARRYLRTTPIYIDKARLTQELGGRKEYLDWKRSTQGLLRLITDSSRKAKGADTIFAEFADNFPGLVDESIWNELDQIRELARAARKLSEIGREKTIDVNPYELGYEEAVQSIGADLANEAIYRLRGIEPARPWDKTEKTPAIPEFRMPEGNPSAAYEDITMKEKSAVMRAERRLTDDLLQAIQSGIKRTPSDSTYRNFRAGVVRPVIEAMLRGEDADVDELLVSTGIDIVGQAAARGAAQDALRRARGELTRIGKARSESEARIAAREARNAELDARIPTDRQGLVDLGEQVKRAKKYYQGLRGRTLMTEEDLELAHRIATGQISAEEAYAQNPFGMDDVINMAEAERAYLDASAPWERYTRKLAKERYDRADAALEDAGADTAKDKASGFQYARETPERNMRDVFSNSGGLISDYIRPIHAAEAASTRFKNAYNSRVKELGISQKVSRGNAASEAYAVQFLGEAEDNIRVLTLIGDPAAVRDGMNLAEWQTAVDEFRAANPNLDYDKVQRGIREFAKIYGELIERMNGVLVETGYLPVNTRRGYFPHFTAGTDGVLATFAHLLGIKIENQALPTAINGLTDRFKPGKPWFSHSQERTGFRTDYDALQGFDGYLKGVSDVIHQTPNIRNLRALATRIRYRFGDEGIRKRINEIEANEGMTDEEKLAAISDLTANGKYKLSRFVSWLDEYTNLLASKKSKYDRGIEDLVGRRMYTWMKNIEGRVAANMIAGNLSSALTNFIPLNQAGAVIGDAAMLRGAFDTMAGRARHDGFVERSDFLTNRRGVDPLIRGGMDKFADFLSKPMNIIDDFTSETIVRAAYAKNVKAGMDPQSAMEAADELAAGLMADRSKGALPTIFGSNNPLTKLFTQFQVEVNNEFSTIFKDIPKRVFRRDKDKKQAVAAVAWTLLRYFLGAYLFNDLYEKIVGRRAALDPVDLLNDAVGDATGYKLNNVFDMISEGVIEDAGRANPSDAIMNFAANAAEELPFVGGLLGGGRIPISSALPDMEKIVKGIANENWSGGKKLETVGRELGKSVGTYILPPFAGGLGKKIWQTGENAIRGGRYVKDSAGEEQLQYPYYMDNPLESVITIAQSTLFGPTGTEGGREWVENDFNTLSAKKTKVYEMLQDDFGEDRRTSYDLITTFYKILPTYDADGNGTIKQSEVTDALEGMTVPLTDGEGALQGLFGGSMEERPLTREEKAVLWQSYNKAWKPEKNPFDPAIGAEVFRRLNGGNEEE